LVDYFLKQSLERTTDFAHCVCCHGYLNDGDERKLQQKWLAMQHLTVIEEENCEIVEIKDDQDMDKKEEMPCVSTQDSNIVSKKKKLRWNFPTFGLTYVYRCSRKLLTEM